MNKTNFERFSYQCQLSGMTFRDFCRISTISESAAHDLLDSNGGRKYLINELGKLREETITVGDVLQVLIVHGIQCGFDGRHINILHLGAGYSSITVSDDYEERQKQLGEILLGVEE